MFNLKKITIFILFLFAISATLGCANITTSSSTTLSPTTISTTSPSSESTGTTSPTTQTPTTMVPTTSIPTTVSPTTVVPTTMASTTEITTIEQTTTLTTTDLTTFTTDVSSTTAGYLGIEVVEIRKSVYEFREAFDEDSITVIIRRTSGQTITLNKSLYTVSGFDSSTPGDIELLITFGDYQTTFTVTILEFSGVVIEMAYYLSAQGLSGNELFLELRSIINTGKTYVSYDAARYILDDSDADPDKLGNVILIYSGYSVSGVWDNGVTWNREHVWPQSLLGYNTIMSADLHNLKPADPSFNSSRGNKYFDNVTTSSAYEPRDEVKGDVARILLYMWTMYSALELVNENPTTYQMALLSVLLQWHIMDPVDDFERNRNEVIYSHQNNRNPYIDYPEFVHLIWG